MERRYLSIPLFFLVLTLINVNVVYASGDVSLPDFPEAFGNATGISEFSAGVLLSGIFLLICLLPLNMLRKGSGFLPNVIVGFVVMSSLVVLGWLPSWILILIALIVAVLWSSKITDLLGRRGE